MVQRVTIDPSEVSASRALAEANKTTSPQGGTGWDPSVTINANAISGRVDASGNVTSLGKHTGTASLRDDGQIDVGGMTVSKEVALDQGWIRENAAGQMVAVDGDFKQAIVEQQGREVEAFDAAETDAEIAESFNRAYDHIEADIGRNAMVKWADAVAEGNEEALNAVPSPIFDGYMSQAQDIADELGIYDVSGYASALLEGEDQTRLIKAVISNDRQMAQTILARGEESLHEMSTDPEAIAELTRNGYSIQGTGSQAVITFPNGAQMSFFQCFRDGHFTT